MMSAGGRYVLIYNGELYNFQELRAELEAKGVLVPTQERYGSRTRRLSSSGETGLSNDSMACLPSPYGTEVHAASVSGPRSVRIKPLYWYC